MQYVRQHNKKSLKQITIAIFKNHGYDLSPTSISRRLKASRAKKVRCYGKPVLSENHKIARLNFAMKHSRANWSKYIFSDEVCIQLFGNTVQVWSWPDDQYIYCKPKKSPSRMFWACFDINGVSNLVEVKGRVNSEKYCDILQHTLLPFMQQQDRQNHFFIQDNAPVHTSKVSKTWLKTSRVKTIKWPANSPDLNPIENLWSTLKKRVQAREPKSIEEVVTFAKEEWLNIPMQILKSLVESMPSRLKLVKAVQGAHTKY